MKEEDIVNNEMDIIIEDFCSWEINDMLFNIVRAYSNVDIRFNRNDNKGDKIIEIFDDKGNCLRSMKCNTYSSMLRMLLQVAANNLCPRNFKMEDRTNGEAVEFNGVKGIRYSISLPSGEIPEEIPDDDMKNMTNGIREILKDSKESPPRDSFTKNLN